MTVVFLLWHHGDEYPLLRGIYFSAEEARKDLPVEVFEKRYITRRDERDGIVGEHCLTYRHTEDCCSVDQETIRDRATGAVALPPRPFVPADALIPRMIEEAVREVAIHAHWALRERSADAPTQEG